MCIFRLLTLMLACSHGFSAKIYGGQKSMPHSRPYMALVTGTKSDNSVEYCAGFLLNEWFVMTAAHCLSSTYTVHLGLHDFSHQEDDVQIISVDRAFPDTQYNNTTYSNDIMLLKLNHEAKRGPKVQPIDLADPNDPTPETCMVLGWGHYKPNSTKMSSVLREVNVTLSKSSECDMDSYCSFGTMGPRKGDSGCPLVCENGKVYGVLSTGTDPNENGERKYQYRIVTKGLPPVI